MKKIFIIIIILSILILIESYLIYVHKNTKIISVNKLNITNNELISFQNDQNKYFNTDLLESTSLLNLIKYKVYKLICDSLNIRLISIEDLNIEKNDKQYKNFIKNIVQPIIYEMSFNDFVSKDTSNFQKVPYKIAKNIDSQWKNEKDWEKLLKGERVEFFRKKIAIDERDLINKNMKENTNGNFFFNGIDYFYTVKIIDNMMIGFRIKKIPTDTIVKNITKDFNFVFYSPEMYRGIDKISRSSIWHYIIFHNNSNTKMEKNK